MRFFTSIGQGWSFMKEAISMGFRDRTLLRPSIYLVITTILYYAAWVGALIAADVDFEKHTAWILIGIAVFGSFFIFYFFCGMTVNMVDAHLEGKTPSAGEAFRDARQNIFAIIWMAIISSIVSIFTSMLRNDDSVIGRIIAGIINTIWTTLTFLMLPAIIIEDVSMGQALRRVRELHKQNLLLIGVGEVGVRFVTGLVGVVVYIAVAGVVYLSVDVIGGTPGIVIAIVTGGTMIALHAAFSTFVRMAYYTCLYLWARDVEKQGQSAPAPLPLARAIGQVPTYDNP